MHVHIYVFAYTHICKCTQSHTQNIDSTHMISEAHFELVTKFIFLAPVFCGQNSHSFLSGPLSRGSPNTRNCCSVYTAPVMETLACAPLKNPKHTTATFLRTHITFQCVHSYLCKCKCQSPCEQREEIHARFSSVVEYLTM